MLNITSITFSRNLVLSKQGLQFSKRRQQPTWALQMSNDDSKGNGGSACEKDVSGLNTRVLKWYTFCWLLVSVKEHRRQPRYLLPLHCKRTVEIFRVREYVYVCWRYNSCTQVFSGSECTTTQRKF